MTPILLNILIFLLFINIYNIYSIFILLIGLIFLLIKIIIYYFNNILIVISLTIVFYSLINADIVAHKFRCNEMNIYHINHYFLIEQ